MLLVQLYHMNYLNNIIILEIDNSINSFNSTILSHNKFNPLFPILLYKNNK